MLVLVYNKHLLAFNLLTSYDESLHVQTVPRERERERVCGSRFLGLYHHGCVRVNVTCAGTSGPCTCVVTTKYSNEPLD